MTTESLRAGELATTIQELRLAHSRDPSNPRIVRNLVNALNARAEHVSEAGRPDEAERDYLEALTLAPGDPQTASNLAAFLNNRAVAFLRERRLPQARLFFERALKQLPHVTDRQARDQIRINYSNLLTAEGDAFALLLQTDQARSRYNEALAHHPHNATALAGLADCDYDDDNYAAALERYQKALEIAAAESASGTLRGAIAERIDLVRKEMAIEADFVAIYDRSGRFRLFFPKNFPQAIIAQTLEALHEAHRRIGGDLDFQTSRPLTVKIYSRAQLNAIQQVPAWVGSFFDGKIRLLDERLLRGTARLRNSIFHEYTHAIVHLRGGEAVPSWLHEGLAQIETAERILTRRETRYLAGQVHSGKAASLAELTAPFDSNTSGDRMTAIYLQSKSLVEFLLQRGGWEKIRQLLSETARLGDFEAAFSGTYGLPTTEIEREWRRWLLDRDAKSK